MEQNEHQILLLNLFACIVYREGCSVTLSREEMEQAAENAEDFVFTLEHEAESVTIRLVKETSNASDRKEAQMAV